MTKSLIAMRREKGAICPICHSPDYRISPNEIKNGKPNIQCGSCGNWWQYGYDGGIYSKYLERENDDKTNIQR